MLINFKKRLYDSMKKDIMSNMKKTKINLGSGIGKRPDSIDSEKEFASNLIEVWNTIKEFGIDPLDLKAVNPTLKELYEIHSAIKAYRISVRYLKLLKGKMGGKSIG